MVVYVDQGKISGRRRPLFWSFSGLRRPSIHHIEVYVDHFDWKKNGLRRPQIGLRRPIWVVYVDLYGGLRRPLLKWLRGLRRPLKNGRWST